MKDLYCLYCNSKLEIEKGYPKEIHNPKTTETCTQTIYQCSSCNKEWILCACGCGKLAPISKRARNKRYYDLFHRQKAQNIRFIEKRKKFPRTQIGTNKYISDRGMKYKDKLRTIGGVQLEQEIKKYKKKNKRKRIYSGKTSVAVKPLPHFDKCPSCDSSNIIYDHAMREIACRNCGLVIYRE